MKRLTEFLTRCRQQLKKEEHLFWVSLQSNLLADVTYVKENFETALNEMKEEMSGKGWILPTLKANMRNQANITNVQINEGCSLPVQSSIAQLASGSSLIGGIPVLFKVDPIRWDQSKDEVLRHCIKLMSKKSEKNIVVLWDDLKFRNVADDIQRVIKDKKIVPYPSKQSKEGGILNVKQFIEKSDHILVTRNYYFNGCESANIILLTQGFNAGIRNAVLRGVENVICVQVGNGTSNSLEINGMKEDYRYSDSQIFSQDSQIFMKKITKVNSV